mgnify:FL=1
MSISIISSTRKNKKKVLENTSTSSFARAIKFNVKHYQLLIVNACTWGDTKASSSATLTVNPAEYRCCLSNKTIKFFFPVPNLVCRDSIGEHMHHLFFPKIYSFSFVCYTISTQISPKCFSIFKASFLEQVRYV